MTLDMARRHLRTLGWLYIVMGGLSVLVALAVMLLMVAGGLLSQDADARATLSVGGAVIAALVVFLSIPSFIAGFGLLRYRRWSKVVTLILAALNLFSFPVGTALGIYSFWVLMQDETTRLLASGGRALPSDFNGPLGPPAPM